MEDITRADLEQLFENQATFITKGMQDMESRLDERMARLEIKMDNVVKQNNEDMVLAFQEIARLKKRVDEMEKINT